MVKLLDHQWGGLDLCSLVSLICKLQAFGQLDATKVGREQYTERLFVLKQICDRVISRTEDPSAKQCARATLISNFLPAMSFFSHSDLSALRGAVEGAIEEFRDGTAQDEVRGKIKFSTLLEDYQSGGSAKLLPWPLQEAFASFCPGDWLSSKTWLARFASQVVDQGKSLAFLVRHQYLKYPADVAGFLECCPDCYLSKGMLPVEYYGDKSLAIAVGVKILDAISPTLQEDEDVLLNAASEGLRFFVSKVGRRHRSNLRLACRVAETQRTNLHHDVLEEVSKELLGERQLQA
jgi:hypothetical protein